MLITKKKLLLIGIIVQGGFDVEGDVKWDTPTIEFFFHFNKIKLSVVTLVVFCLFLPSVSWSKWERSRSFADAGFNPPCFFHCFLIVKRYFNACVSDDEPR